MHSAGRFFWFLVFAGLTAGAAWLAGLYSPSGAPGAWYDALQKPTWQPPTWAFGVVWPVLYIMIAVAGWRVFIVSKTAWANLFWIAQLVLNIYWVFLFFDQRLLTLALGEIWVLWFAIGGFFFTAWRHSRLASWLFIPYWCWVTFALCLNMEIVRLNG